MYLQSGGTAVSYVVRSRTERCSSIFKKGIMFRHNKRWCKNKLKQATNTCAASPPAYPSSTTAARARTRPSQDGTAGDDELRAAAVRLSDGMIVVGGYTGGGWGDYEEDERNWAVIALDASGSFLWNWEVKN